MVNRIEGIINCPKVWDLKKGRNIMKKIKGMKYCFIAAAIGLLAVLIAAPAGAGNLSWKLHGDYTYNVAATCAHAACGQDLENNCCLSQNKPAGCNVPCKYNCDTLRGSTRLL